MNSITLFMAFLSDHGRSYPEFPCDLSHFANSVVMFDHIFYFENRLN
jgi:hypothetical protein